MNLVASSVLIALTLVLTKFFCLVAQNTRLMDKPNERSLHSVPTVRGGGLVFVGLFLIALPTVAYNTSCSVEEALILFSGVFFIALISFLDDLLTLSAKVRFLVQSLVAGLAAFMVRPDAFDFILFSVVNTYFILGFTCFTTLWAINHFNFMDGLDGFCGAQALFLFFSYALFFGDSGALFYQVLCCVLIFGLIGFLAYNLPPARLFMGDVGSATLGFISFYMALIAQYKYQVPILYWFILNGLFLFDSTITLLRRIHQKEQWFAAHRKHAYQRLKQYGMNTRVILLGQLAINLLLLSSVLVIRRYNVQPIIFLLLSLGLLIILYRFIEKLYPMFDNVEG